MDLILTWMVGLAIVFVAGSPIWLPIAIFWYFDRELRKERKRDKEYLDWLAGKRDQRKE